MSGENHRNDYFDDLKAALETVVQVDRDIARLMEERKKHAKVARLLMDIMEIQLGKEKLWATIEKQGLASLVASVFPAGERKPVEEAPKTFETVVARTSDEEPKRARKPRKRRAKPRDEEPLPPGTLPRRTRVRILGGKYSGHDGFIRRARVRNGVFTYEVEIPGYKEEGRTRTDLSPSSLGKMWQVVEEPQEEKAEPAPRVERPRTVLRRRGGAVTPVTESPATSPQGEVLPPGTKITMLSGKHVGWSGPVVFTVTQGNSLVYDVNLRGPAGERLHSRVSQSTRGRTWDVEGAPGVAAAQAQAPAAAEQEVAEPPPPAQTGEAQKPAEGREPAPGEPAPGEPAQASDFERATERATQVRAAAVLEKGTPVRMLTGIYLGYTGVISSVQSKVSRGNVEALYSLVLTGPNNETVRTTVKHSSLGRMWVPIR